MVLSTIMAVRNVTRNQRVAHVAESSLITLRKATVGPETVWYGKFRNHHTIMNHEANGPQDEKHKLTVLNLFPLFVLKPVLWFCTLL